MDRGGEKLRRVREQLKLTFRDVERLSQEISHLRQRDEFCIALSRLADIENKGTIPTIYRLYTLCAIYRLDFDEVLRWYGVPRAELAPDSLHLTLEATHLVNFAPNGPLAVPEFRPGEMDLSKTTLLRPLAPSPRLSFLRRPFVRQVSYFSAPGATPLHAPGPQHHHRLGRGVS